MYLDRAYTAIIINIYLALHMYLDRAYTAIIN